VSKYGAKDWTEILKGQEFTQIQGRKKTRYVIKSITYERNLDISNNKKVKEIISVNNYVVWFVALNKPDDEQYLLLLDVLNFAKKGNEAWFIPEYDDAIKKFQDKFDKEKGS